MKRWEKKLVVDFKAGLTVGLLARLYADKLDETRTPEYRILCVEGVIRRHMNR